MKSGNKKSSERERERIKRAKKQKKFMAFDKRNVDFAWWLWKHTRTLHDNIHIHRTTSTFLPSHKSKELKFAFLFSL